MIVNHITRYRKVPQKSQTAYIPMAPSGAAGLLGEDEAHIWLIDLDAPALPDEAMEKMLSAEEAAQCDAFAFAQLRSRYLAAHGQMRVILSAYATCPIEALDFDKGPEGKPYLRGKGELHPAFNLTHSANWAILAVARQGDLGVDTEQVRRTGEFDSLAESVFAPMEYAAYQRLPDSARLTAFFTCWTRKEAVIKADGRGLSMKLDTFAVTVEPEVSPTIEFDPGAVREGFHPKLFDLPAPKGFCAALAAAKTIDQLRFFCLPPQGYLHHDQN